MGLLMVEALVGERVERYLGVADADWEAAATLEAAVRLLWDGWRLRATTTGAQGERGFVFTRADPASGAAVWGAMFAAEAMTGGGRTWRYPEMDAEDRRRLLCTPVRHFTFFGSDPLGLLEDIGSRVGATGRETAAQVAAAVLGLVPVEDRAGVATVAALGRAAPVMVAPVG